MKRSEHHSLILLNMFFLPIRLLYSLQYADFARTLKWIGCWRRILITFQNITSSVFKLEFFNLKIFWWCCQCHVDITVTPASFVNPSVLNRAVCWWVSSKNIQLWTIRLPVKQSCKYQGMHGRNYLTNIIHHYLHHRIPEIIK